MRHQEGGVPGGTQRVGRIFVETLELQKNERSLVADPAIANPRNVSRPRELSTWLRNGRYFDSFFRFSPAQVLKALLEFLVVHQNIESPLLDLGLSLLSPPHCPPARPA